jgi:hypothetical protein
VDQGRAEMSMNLKEAPSGGGHGRPGWRFRDSRAYHNRTGALLGIDIGGKNEVYFGQNLLHDSPKNSSLLSVGDPLTVFV